jgi:hypothetical protein
MVLVQFQGRSAENDSKEPIKKWYSWVSEASLTLKISILGNFLLSILLVIVVILYVMKKDSASRFSTSSDTSSSASSGSKTSDTSSGSLPSVVVTGTPIDASKVYGAYYKSDLKGDEEYGKGVYVKFGQPTNLERRLPDGKYLIGVDLGKDYEFHMSGVNGAAEWEGYAVICSPAQVKQLRETGLKVKVKKVQRTSFRNVAGVFVIMEAMN